MKLVSVVVSVYNMEAYLDRFMKTILAQSYKNIEIILINDGSQDKSGNMCDEYEKMYPEKVRVFHKKNGGLSSARNKGIEQAKGEYVIFPDPDDWVEPEYIEKAVMLKKEYDVDLVCLGYFVEYDDISIPANSNEKLLCMNKEEAKRALLLSPRIGGFAWNKLYDLDVIRNKELKFLDDVGTTEDLEFAFHYLQNCDNVCFAPEERVYHYYQRKGAATNGKFSEKKVESIRTYEKIIEQAENDFELIRAAENEICNTAINLCWLYKRDGYDNNKLWNAIRKYLRKYIITYLKSENYNIGRKIQALVVYFMPNLYAEIKNRAQK